MKLGDIFHSAAFKHRNDRELALDVTGMDYQVFEATDLDVASGTDWSGVNRHVIGTFSAIPVGGLLVSLLIETSDLPPDGRLTLYFGTVGSLGGITGVSTDQTKKWNSTVPAYLSDFTAEVGSSTDPVPESQDFEVRLSTDDGSPTTAPIHIVRARCAVLVI